MVRRGLREVITVFKDISPIFVSQAALGIIQISSRPYPNSTVSQWGSMRHLIDVDRRPTIDMNAANNQQPTHCSQESPRTLASMLNSAVYHQLVKALSSGDLCATI